MSLLGCERFRDSKKSATTLTLSATVTGGYSKTNALRTETIVLSGTVTATYTREPFPARDFYTAAAQPDADKFWIASKCCCWKCRAEFMAGENPSIIGAGPNLYGAFTATRTIVSTPPDPSDGTADIPVNEIGAASIRAMGDGLPCREAGDARVGTGDVQLGFAYASGGVLFHRFLFGDDFLFYMAKDWELTLSDGGSLSGSMADGWPAITYPASSSTDHDALVTIPICDEAWSASAESHWTGAADNGFGTTYALDATLAIGLALS